MEEDAKGGFLDTKWVRPLFVCIHPQWSHYPVVLDVMGRVLFPEAKIPLPI